MQTTIAPEYESLLAMLNSIYPMSEALTKDIIDISEIVAVNKKTVLLTAGKTSNTIYFIVRGAARVYYMDKKDDEVTSWFLFEGELLISVFSFFAGEPGFEFIETLEDCILISLNREKLNEFYTKHLEFNFIGRKLTEYYYIKSEKQTNDFRMLSAKERYEQLLATNPQLIQRVALGYIASFLGVSQETLSRIRKQI